MIALSDLIVIACLAAAPTECERHVIATPDPVVTCLMQLPMTATRWALSRPDWTVSRVECRKHMDEA